MNSHCENCDGTGMIEDDDGSIDDANAECGVCEGTGKVEICISQLKIGLNLRHRTELLALKQDAHRVISECGKLLTRNPPHWESYVAQLKKTISEIENHALELLP